MTELTREDIEAHTGLELTDWQWHCVKAIQGASGYGTYALPYYSGKKFALEQPMKCYQALGYRVERVGYGYLIYEPEEQP